MTTNKPVHWFAQTRHELAEIEKILLSEFSANSVQVLSLPARRCAQAQPREIFKECIRLEVIQRPNVGMMQGMRKTGVRKHASIWKYHRSRRTVEQFDRGLCNDCIVAVGRAEKTFGIFSRGHAAAKPCFRGVAQGQVVISGNQTDSPGILDDYPEQKKQALTALRTAID
jgi:hypothetical protein